MDLWESLGYCTGIALELLLLYWLLGRIPKLVKRLLRKIKGECEK